LEQEASLTDAGIIMFDKMLGSMFRRADHEHRERMVDRAKALDAATRTLLPMAKAMLAARASGADLLVAVEGSIGWQRLETLVDEAAATLMDTREDNLSEVIGRYPTVRRIVPVLLDAFTFRSWKTADPLLVALDLLRGVLRGGRAEASRPSSNGVPQARVAQACRLRGGDRSPGLRSGRDGRAARPLARRRHLGRRQSGIPRLR